MAEITEWAAFLERHGGPPEMLAAARSWLAMLGHPPDPQVADLFAVMVRVDRAIWLEWLNEHPAAADAALEQLRDIVRGTP